MTTEAKACIRCGTRYADVPANFYFRRDSGKYRNECKACQLARFRENGKAHYRNNPEYYRDRNERYYRENRGEHLERTNRRRREVYWENPQAGRERVKRYRQARPEKVLEWAHRRRAQKLSAPGQHTAEDIKAQRRRQRGKCYWCKEKIAGSGHVDHVTPLSRGGNDGPGNIVIACPDCNLRKSNKMPGEFAGVLL